MKISGYTSSIFLQQAMVLSHFNSIQFKSPRKSWRQSYDESLFIFKIHLVPKNNKNFICDFNT